jgi:hypothetical protein
MVREKALGAISLPFSSLLALKISKKQMVYDHSIFEI